MKLYAGIDLHSNNSMIAVIDEQDRGCSAEETAQRARADLARAGELQAVVGGRGGGVDLQLVLAGRWADASWLPVHLANPAAIVQYQGLKYSADEHDARWLAHLLRLRILREGYIYPREARAVRDLMRRRMQLVQTRSAQLGCDADAIHAQHGAASLERCAQAHAARGD